MYRRANIHRLLALVCLALTSSSCFGSIFFWQLPDVSDVPREGWHELRSPDFVLYGPFPRDTLERFAVDLARFIAVAERLVEGHPPRTKANVFLLDDESRRLIVRSRWVAGFMTHTLAGFDGVVGATQHDPVARHVFLHEFSHYLNLRNNRLNYPIWYREGFAEFIGATRTRDNVVEIGVTPPWRITAFRHRQRRGEPIELEEIFSFDRNSSSRMPNDFYALSWATVHFLYSSPEHRRGLVSMIERQARGMDWRSAYDQSFTEPVEHLSARVDQHLSLLSLGTSGAIARIPVDELDVRTDWETRELEPNEAARVLAELIARGAAYGARNYTLRLSESFFEEALRQAPNDSRAIAGLAEILARQKRFGASRARLAAFERDPAPSFEALLHAGDATYRLAVDIHRDDSYDEALEPYAAALDLYRRALDLRLRNPVALAGIGRVELATGRLHRARDSFARAQANGEWDAGLTLDRGRVEARADEVERARAYWQEVIRLGHEEAIEEARELLDELD